MAEKRLNTRIVHKHEIEANWKLSSLVPMQGELIIYDIDDNYSYERIKIGDGQQNVNALPFVNDALRIELLGEISSAISGLVTEEYITTAIKNVKMDATNQDAVVLAEAQRGIEAVSALVGDKKVSEQINTAIANKADAPKLTSVSILASNWAGESNPWSQVVTINGVTENSKIDLQPTASQIIQLQDNDIALMAENNGGVVTIYALGSKPATDYTMQALIMEVVVV